MIKQQSNPKNKMPIVILGIENLKHLFHISLKVNEYNTYCRRNIISNRIFSIPQITSIGKKLTA